MDLSLESLSLANDNQNISNDKISNKHPENVRNNDLIKIDNGCDNIRKEITFEVLNQNKQHNEASKNEDNFINKYEKPISKVIDYGNDIQRHGLITNDESSGINFAIYYKLIASNNQDENKAENIQKANEEIRSLKSDQVGKNWFERFSKDKQYSKPENVDKYPNEN